MNQIKYRELLEAVSEEMGRTLHTIHMASVADNQRLQKHFDQYGDLYYRAPNSDLPTDIVMMPVLAIQAPRLKSLVDSLEVVQEKLHGKAGEGWKRDEEQAADKPKLSPDEELVAMGFKI